MDLAVIFTTKKDKNTLQIVDTTLPNKYFALLELEESAYNPIKSHRSSLKYDFTFEGIGTSLVFISTEIQTAINNHNKFQIEVYRNSLNDVFTASIKPNTVFYSIQADNAVEAFICAIQIMFNNTDKNELSNVFKPNWDNSILGSVYNFVCESFKKDSSVFSLSSTIKTKK